MSTIPVSISPNLLVLETSNLVHDFVWVMRLFVLVSFLYFFLLRVLDIDKAEYSAFESTLNSSIVSYRIILIQQFYWCTTTSNHACSPPPTCHACGDIGSGSFSGHREANSTTDCNVLLRVRNGQRVAQRCTAKPSILVYVQTKEQFPLGPFLPRNAMHSADYASQRVCPVTRRHCDKTAKHIVEIPSF